MIKYNGETIMCVCEGNFEYEIIEILLDNDLLFFTREDLIEEKPTKIRSASRLQTEYLNRKFEKGLIILRIIDSKSDKFRLSKEYENKVNQVNDVITKPEIEILIIIDKDHYHEYTQKYKSRKSPSNYCKRNLRLKKLKSKGFAEDYFQDPSVLVNAISSYNKLSNQKDLNLYDLLNSETKRC